MIIEIETEEDRKNLEELLKTIPGKIKMVSKTRRPIESLLDFAEKTLLM